MNKLTGMKCLIVILISLSFISCRRNYYCECVNVHGVTETQRFTSDRKDRSKKMCEESKSNWLTYCELK